MQSPDPISIEHRNIRVCYFGTYRANYERNRLMIDRLRSQGIDVVECHARLWRGIEDREQIAGGGWLDPRFFWRFASVYVQLIARYLRIGRYDVMIVGYPGQIDIPLARFLTWLHRKPLVWDVLMSVYLIAMERGLDGKSPFTVRMIRKLEGFAIHLPDWLIIDTPVYAEWYKENYELSGENFFLLPLGADDRVFRPLSEVNRVNTDFRCLYYGTFIPNHGVQYIIDAANLLRENTEIKFELIGQGPERDRLMLRAQRYNLKNIKFIDWMEKKDLIVRIAASDVVLGTFGSTPQALMTMQNKIHEGLAMAKPVINGDSSVMRAVLEHGNNIYLCQRENAKALADAIFTLWNDAEFRIKIAEGGHRFYLDNLKFDLLGSRLQDFLSKVSKF